MKNPKLIMKMLPTTSFVHDFVINTSLWKFTSVLFCVSNTAPPALQIVSIDHKKPMELRHDF